MRRISSGPRDKLPDVGAAMRSAIERACAADPELTASEWRVFAAVISETCSWSRMQDDVPMGRLANTAGGLSRKQCTRILRSLEARGIVVYRPGHGKQWSRMGVSRNAPNDVHSPVDMDTPESGTPPVDTNTPGNGDTCSNPGGCGHAMSTPCVRDQAGACPYGVDTGTPGGGDTSTEEGSEELSEKWDSHLSENIHPWLMLIASAALRADAKRKLLAAGFDVEMSA